MASKTSISGMLMVFFSIFLMTLMPGCIPTPSTQNVTSTSPLVCNPPYIQVGTGCCLDNNSNNICDQDEGVTTVLVTSTSAAGTSTTSTSTTISPVAQKITSKKIMLSGDLRADVDVVFTPDRKKALMSTRILAGRGHMDIIDIALEKIINTVKLSGDLRSGVDPLITSDGKTALMPVRNPLTNQSSLDIIDITSASIKKSVALAGDLQYDVDVYITPDGKTALIPSRISTLRKGYLDQIDISTGTVNARHNLKNDLREGVDVLITSDGTRAFMASMHKTAGSSVDIINIPAKTIFKTLGIPGDLQYDVDPVLVEDSSILLVPTSNQGGAYGYLSVIDYSSGAVLHKVKLSGALQKYVDVRLAGDKKTAFVPSHKGAQGYVDFIDIAAGTVTYTITLSGDLRKGVDLMLNSDGKIILMPSYKGAQGYVDVIDVGAGTLTHTVKLSGDLRESVDVIIINDQKTALMPSYVGAQGYVDVIDFGAGAVINTVVLSGTLQEDVDVLVMLGENTALMPSSKWKRGYLNILGGVSSGLALMPVTSSGWGYVDVIDVSSAAVILAVKLPGDVYVGVDCLASKPVPLTPHVDEDMVVEDESGVDTTTSTTTTVIRTTSTSTTTTVDGYTSTTTGETTIPDGTTSTSTSSTSTTTIAPVITPRCGDGYLSHPGVPGGGHEECDDPPYPCPGGLECVNCKCVGCGDGRLQQGEGCDPFNWMSYVGDTPLWEGQEYGCDPPASCEDCECVLPDRDGDGVTDGEDNCPDDYNPQQKDRDGDDIGDGCDGCPDDPYNDEDHDGVCGNEDNCPDVPNPTQSDLDGDGIGDQCDLEPVDCDAYCGSAANGGYVPRGFDVADSQTCHDQYMLEECDKPTCYLTCCYSYFYRWSWSWTGGSHSFSCCCVKVFRFHCWDCPGQNPQCPDGSLCGVEEPSKVHGGVEEWYP